MTDLEARARSKEKSDQIQKLLIDLQIEAKAKQVIQNGFIENVIVFTDNEKYDIDTPAAPEPIKAPIVEASAEETTSEEK